ncbi:hypothetical protein KDK95_16170 [Actinospica sp. MGRD01-02]|uniref:Uncharacterized protein n=1 Tax=Actinospica acidithermotolerans TaxID=2828514 RepID=A0A941EAA0_9ACTN|nr:hypothetical protein [Actinospica acidithermotolerans]MBR7827856.1 hypothetical protein [Actinospica acidithermotolerans]
MGLVLVAACFTALQIATVPPRLPLGWDEVVYTSQVAVRAPAAYFDAPRARGVTLLAAGAAALSSSTVLLRLWMSLLAGVGLVAAYWPWRRLLAARVVVLAAALFASLWVVGFYADEVMPNLYVAYGTVAAVGWFLRSVAVPRAPRSTSAALAASMGFTALIRPSDAMFLAVPLLVAGLAVRTWRHIGVVVGLVAGLAAGTLPWIIEADMRFGGVVARLQAGSAEQDGMSLHNAVGMELRALNGPTLCRPCTVPWTHPQLSLWWFAMPLLATTGVLIAARGTSLGTLLLPTACAAVVSTQYLLLIDYAAPRFLMPTYALLALPVAACIVGLVSLSPARLRPAAVAVAALALAAQAGSQYYVLHNRAREITNARTQIAELARKVSATGLHAPCTLAGLDMLEYAFYLGCSWQPSASPAPQEHLAMAQPAGRPLPDVARSWKHCSLVLPNGSNWDLYLAPAADAVWRC